MSDSQNSFKQPEAKELRDGTILLQLKHTYLNDQNEQTFNNFMSCLLDSFLLLPAKSINGTAYPLIITSSEGKNALPVFSNIEQVGNEFNDEDIDFYKMTLTECIEFLTKVDECTDIVLDPFTEQFIIEEKLSNEIMKMKDEGKLS